MKKFLFIILIIICVIANLLAQDDENSLTYQPAQVTFFYPIGIFGIHSQDFRYNFSLNILAGRTGGAEGFEAAGLVNVNDNFIKGFQAAGIGNLCRGNGDAFQTAGIFNLVRHDFTGFQSAGIVNANGGKTQAAQFAGIGNFTNGLQGAQFGGIINISSAASNGAQFAGIVNTTIGNSNCFQVGGIANIAEKIKGGQVAGIGNAALAVDGIQIGGIFNASTSVDGGQIAGIVNLAVHVKGTQIAGVLNICDSIDGVPIALVSIVRKNGYRKFELSYNEFTWLNATFKTGVRKFYTLFTLGYNPENEQYNISYGFGIGTSLLLKNQHSTIDIELRSSQLSDNFTTDKLLINNTLIADYALILFKRVEIFAGPSINILVADNSLMAVKVAPGWAMAYKYDNKIWGWVGFHAGLRF